MKNRMNRWLVAMLAVLLAVSCWGAVSSQTQASGYDVSGLEEIGMVNSDFLGNGMDHSAVIYWYMNGTGKISYCLQYGYSLSSGQEFTSTGSAFSDLSKEQVRQLCYCLYYGYQAGGYGICPHAGGITCQEEWIPYAATQAMVWLIAAGKYGEPGAVAEWGKIVADSTDYSARVLAEYETLYMKMEAAMEMEPPSFSGMDKASVPSYTMEWDAAQSMYTVTLPDENGVLSSYNWTLPDGVTAVRNGNQITFSTAQELGGEMVQFDAKSGSAANREISALLFWQPSDASKQNQVQYESVTYDPIRAYLYLKTGEKSGTLRLRKLDSETGDQIGDAVYGVYSDSACGTLVTKITTDVSGYAESGELPAGTYYVREITAPPGYQLSETVYSVDVEAGTTVNLDVEDPPRFVSVSIMKTDAVSGDILTGTKFVLEEWSEELKAFVQADEPHFDPATERFQTGKLKYTKDNQGRYRVYESQTQEGYLDEKWTQSFVVTDYASGHVLEYQVTNTPTRYRFVKTNDQGQPLAGCAFELLNGSGELIDTWVTDESGAHELIGVLIEGDTYTLREVDCPLGYAKAKDYTFAVTSEKEWVEFITANARIDATVRVNKQDGSGAPLDGAEFTLLTTQAVSGAETYTYQGKTYYVLDRRTVVEGTVSFEGIDASGTYEYLLIETKSVEGAQMLSEPIVLGTLPAVAVNGIGAEYTGRQQTKDGVTYLYDLTYSVVNGANMVLPLTGEANEALVMIPLSCVAMVLMAATKKGKKEEKRRNKG